MRANLFTKTIVMFALLWSANSVSQAATIFVGSNATDSVQQYTTAGALIGPFGGPIGTGTALDGQGHVYVADPTALSSAITKYDAAQASLGTTVFNGGVDNGVGYEGFILDMAYGGGGTLWLAAYNGIVYHINAAGAVLHHFDTGSPSTGIASDGTYLYTSQGMLGGDIYQRMMDGTLVSTIATGLPETFGLGLDRSDGSFWVGGSDVITHASAAGMILNTLSIAGIHYGIEVGDIGTAAIPEPATLLISGLGLAGLILFKRKDKKKPLLLLLALVALGTAWTPRLDAAITVNLTAAPVQPQPVGTKITWTVSATDTAPGTLDYRYSVRNPGGAFRIVWDYSPSTTFEWTPGEREGGYEVRVTVRNKTTQATQDRTEMYMMSSRVTGGVPVVSSTVHPQVALYSAPACAAGSQMRVRFQKTAGDPYGQRTPLKPCTPGVSMNFYIAGMLANSQYSIKHDLFTGPIVITGPTLSFTTGSLPSGFPTYTVKNPPDPPSSLAQPIILNTSVGGATDLQGRTLWYPPSGSTDVRRPLPGGTFLLQSGSLDDLLEEIDLVGNVLQQTNLGRVNEQLVAMGKQPIIGFHHEYFRLPNGNTVSLCYNERIMSDVQGPGPVDILGDAIVVLDKDLKVVWFWNSFDHLDVKRKAILDEKCNSGGGGGCPSAPLLLPVANDWLHSNSVAYDVRDGNFIQSIRHQDWVIKINYANGAGDGKVIWRLGKDGDFSYNSSDPYPWQSHQHDAEFEWVGTEYLMSLYDNANTRRVAFPTANSRGQVLRLDEPNRKATFVLNADLGVYSGALGSAQRLLNGTYHFNSGTFSGMSRSQEVNPSGALTFELEANRTNYRSFRMRDMYTPY